MEENQFRIEKIESITFLFSPSFLSYAVFEGIVRKHIQKIRGPANQCLQAVNFIVEKVTMAVIDQTLSEFEPLKMEVKNVMNRERKKAEKNATDALGLVFAMENLVFTQDGNFSRLLQDINEEDEAQKTENVSSSEESTSVTRKKGQSHFRFFFLATMAGVTVLAFW